MKKPMIELTGIQKNFRDLEVIRDLTLEAYESEVVGVMGPSGTGKTTLLKCIAGLEEINSGKIFFEGKDITNASHEKLNGEIGIVFQDYNLWPHKTVLQNIIEAPMQVRKTGKEKAIKKARELLKEVDLTDKEDYYPHELSGGQQQRAAIARALAMQPKILLLDEITSALDPELIKEVNKIIEKLAKKGTTMIIVSHQKNFLQRISDRILKMEKGRLKTQ